MMRWLVLATLMVPCAASADGYYFTEKVGGAKVSDELSAYMSGALEFRIGVGMRRHNWSAEVWMGGDMNTGAEPGYYDTNYTAPLDLFEYGIDLKLIEPVSKHLEVYLRGTASGAQVEEGSLDNWHGRGLGFGAGVQLKGKVSAWGLLFWPLYFTNLGPKITGALYIDDGYDFYRLHGHAAHAVDAAITHITFGYAVGTDF